LVVMLFFFFSSRRRHTRCLSDWSSDVCSSDLDGSQSVKPVSWRAGDPYCTRTPASPIGFHLGKVSWRFPTRTAHWMRCAVLSWRSEERRVGKGATCGGASEDCRDRETDALAR